MAKLKPKHNHDHFWIEDNVIYESYKTIRGMRYMAVAEVVMEDKDKLEKSDIDIVNHILSVN